MIYYGAIHYFFEEGLQRALNDPQMDLNFELYELIPIESETAEKACEAFLWGFYFGLELGELKWIYLDNF